MSGPPEAPLALVLTDGPVAITVRPLEDERTPEGMVCLATWFEGRLIGRCVVPPEVAVFLAEHQLLEQPVPLALAAREEPPGLQCRLFAVVELPLEAEEGAEPEPWAASVPSSSYEEVIRAENGPEQGGSRQAAVLLGHVVRFARDRKHPDSLPMEAADVLASLVSGQATDVVDKVLEDLLGE